MDDDRKVKLAAARAKAAKLRQAQEDALARDYLDWVKLERETYSALLRARINGDRAQELSAQADFRAAWSIMPKLAPKAAFMRVRGMADIDTPLPPLAVIEDDSSELTATSAGGM